MILTQRKDLLSPSPIISGPTLTTLYMNGGGSSARCLKHRQTTQVKPQEVIAMSHHLIRLMRSDLMASPYSDSLVA